MRALMQSRDDRHMSTQQLPSRAMRASSGRVVAGVARGLADHLGLSVQWVRIGFIVLTLFGGVGLALYAALWAVLPLAPTDEEPSANRGTDLTRLLALGAVLIGIVLFLAAAGVGFAMGALLPIAIAIIGAALIWQQSDDDQRAEWSATAARAARTTAGPSSRARMLRLSVGTVLVVLGLVGVLISRTSLSQAGQALGTAVLLVAGISIVLFPWLHRLWKNQDQQRRALIRSEERADIAAHVHDSVLQTLTLIQRSAADPREVNRLARAEERALRSWLYAPTGDPTRTFEARLQRDAAEVEETYSATLEVVVVGDAPIDPALTALLAAAREAMINAAQHGGGAASVFAEFSEDSVELYVRDRGQGFDVSAVSADRHGLRESILGRVERAGGSAKVTSELGAGTEILLRMPLTRTDAS